MGTGGRRAGNFVISLDYELMWGVRDHATRASYGRNVLGGRQAIPAMLDLFHRRGIKVTWATVGALLCESKDELVARMKHAAASREVLGSLEDIGPDERRDPYHFGASLARRIASCEGQEIGTHTFSHRCALEAGETLKGFAADVSHALLQLREWGIRCRSIVFPRNQYSLAHLEACSLLGLTHFRGNERAWYYRAGRGRQADQAAPALPPRRQLHQPFGIERVDPPWRQRAARRRRIRADSRVPSISGLRRSTACGSGASRRRWSKRP